MGQTRVKTQVEKALQRGSPAYWVENRPILRLVCLADGQSDRGTVQLLDSERHLSGGNPCAAGVRHDRCYAQGMTGGIETKLQRGRLEECRRSENFCSSIHLRGGDIARSQALEQIQG